MSHFMDSPEMEGISRAIRRDIIEMAHCSQSPHVGSALSCVDILAVLYFRKLRLDPWQDRDIFILSKAHGAMALYATLAARGIIPRKVLAGYFQNNGTLPGHLNRDEAKGIEASTGSLGHGFNMGLGMAFGLKRKKSDRQVFVLIGDGEAQEGSIWEGAMSAPRLGLDNFTAIMDCNNLQGYGRPRDICDFEPMAAKWQAFGWQVFELDGHDHEAIISAMAVSATGKPRMIIARTIKGKGVSFMEDELIWHYYIVTSAHRERALQELA